jgi:hypothetical protein
VDEADMCLYTPVSGVMGPSLAGNAIAYPASNCFDGDVNTFCHSDSHLSTDDPWIRLDYGQTVYPQIVKIVNRQNCCQERVAPSIRIAVGNVPQPEGNPGVLVPVENAPNEIYAEVNEGAKGRYLFVQLPGENRILNLGEITVKGMCSAEAAARYEATEPPTNEPTRQPTDPPTAQRPICQSDHGHCFWFFCLPAKHYHISPENGRCCTDASGTCTKHYRSKGHCQAGISQNPVCAQVGTPLHIGTMNSWMFSGDQDAAAAKQADLTPLP